MESYKQPVKELSRRIIWEHSVETLTSRRNENRILNASYMEHLWLYCQQQLNENLDIATFVKWKEYADICYGEKEAKDLKVAFFCGSEPENDVRHLLRLGVRIENIYAFESDNKSFRAAVESLHNTYPLLKIYKGKIEAHAELLNTKFDIVYADFTGTLIKEYKTIVKLLDLNALSDMSVLIVNTTYPDATDDNISFLTNYFFYDSYFERSVIDGEEVKCNDDKVELIEGCDALGINKENLEDKIRKNFECSYSAFQTSFILDYANRYKASFEVFKQSVLSGRLIDNKQLKKNKTDYQDTLAQEYAESGLSLSSEQYKTEVFADENEKGVMYGHLDCMRIAEIFLQSPYSHSFTDYSKIKEWMMLKDEDIENPQNELRTIDFRAILSNEVRNVIDNIGKWFHGRYDFCDQPMQHLWLELLMNQYGHPYHTNVGNHKRYLYQAKTRKMCLDIFTLDKCRALYDWIPMLEYFIHDMQNHNRQMITRMCIDAIDKQLLHIVDEVYYGAALVGINEYEWSKNKEIPRRREILVDS